MLILSFGGFTLDMKRKASGIFLENSNDSSEGSDKSSWFRVALRYIHLPSLSCESEKGSYVESQGDEEEMKYRDDPIEGFEKNSESPRST